MSDRDRLLTLCASGLKRLHLYDDAHKSRFKQELKEIDNQGEHEYFLKLYDKQTKFSDNENNLLIPYLLNLCPPPEIQKDPSYGYGEWPDIDIDYISHVRDYLKNEWSKKEFGEDNVCAIGNYTTWGIKSALIDCARVFGKDRSEIIALTTKLGLKDDQGKALTFDKALDLFPELKSYCEVNPDVAAAAKKLINRNRGMGMHAGGLIVAKSRIDDLVPLVKGKDNAHVSAFVEGLHGQDLGPLGLIKFDMLVVADLMRIYEILKLVKERHGLKSICALPDSPDWSDLSYLDDPKALSLANEGKLRCIFQFDSEGIRELCRKGGVTGFDDLAAYSSLYRPGPMNCVAKDNKIMIENGSKEIQNLLPFHDKIKYLTNDGIFKFTEKFLLFKSGKKKVLKIKTKNGKNLTVTSDHRILTKNGFIEAGKLKTGDKIVQCKHT